MSSLVSFIGLKWTWADLVSSYRFWGVTAYQLFFMLCFIFFHMYLRSGTNSGEIDASAYVVGNCFAAIQVGLIMGLPFAWIISRVKHSYALMIPCLIYIVAIVMAASVKVGAY